MSSVKCDQQCHNTSPGAVPQLGVLEAPGLRMPPSPMLGSRGIPCKGFPWDASASAEGGTPRGGPHPCLQPVPHAATSTVCKCGVLADTAGEIPCRGIPLACLSPLYSNRGTCLQTGTPHLLTHAPRQGEAPNFSAYSDTPWRPHGCTWASGETLTFSTSQYASLEIPGMDLDKQGKWGRHSQGLRGLILLWISQTMHN